MTSRTLTGFSGLTLKGSSSMSMLRPSDGARALRMKYSRSRKFFPPP